MALRNWWFSAQQGVATGPYVATDTFTRADAPIGNLESGETWFYPGNFWQILSGKALPPSAALADLAQRPVAFEFGAANVDVQVTESTVGTQSSGIVLRYKASNNSCLIVSGFSTYVAIFEMTGASYALKNLDNGVTFADGDVIRATIDGANEIKVYKNGSLVMTFTDAFNAGETMHGMYGGNTDSRLDDFTCQAL